jgi:hypothetical protein
VNASLRAALCLPALLLAACGGPARVQRHQDAREAAYEAAAGAPVASFHFVNLYTWEALGERNAAVYTGADQAWLLDFAGPCPGLGGEGGIALTAYGNEVVAGRDRIEAPKPAAPCPISRIRPVDAARLKKLQKRQLDIRPATRPGRQVPGPATS